MKFFKKNKKMMNMKKESFSLQMLNQMREKQLLEIY